MLDRFSNISDQISSAYESYEFAKFFQILQSFCVVDLSNFYLDIAKDRLYVSAPNDFRRKSCQFVLSKVMENLAVMISPVLSHMAEDIWQNIPYEIPEKSVFQRGWPKIPPEWKNPDIEKNILLLRKLRNEVNKSIENCRNQQKIGAALETKIRFYPKDKELNNALIWLENSGNKKVDTYSDWLIVSEFEIEETFLEDSLLIEDCELGQIQIAKAFGYKCDRCWHYQKEVIDGTSNTKLCKRCAGIIRKI